MTLRRLLVLLLFPSLAAGLVSAQTGASQAAFGYADFTAQARLEQRFLALPSAKLAGQDLRILTAQPHMAATPEDYKTAQFVARKFRAAGLDTQIVPYRVLLNWPVTVRVEAYDAAGHLLMTGPGREHVQGDPYQDNPRIVMPFNSSSGSGDVTADVVYANYGRIQDFNRLAALHVDLHGKIVLCRYGLNFRGVKVQLAEKRGAVGVLLYSDPQDDGSARGSVWPQGPWRPDTGVQRGSVQYLATYPGDPETPGFASTPGLPDSARVSGSGNQPHIISIPLSSHDAAPILKALQGPGAPLGWQGALPFPYHVGPGGVRVHLVSKQDYERRIIWDVIGTLKGAQYPDALVITGNHRDAWVFGAADPSSGTAAMLETVRSIGVLALKGWRPRRTLVFCSWDAEEEGLIGSTEWVEQHTAELEKAVAYLNTDVAVSGPNFAATASPSLQDFVREIAKVVPSPLGGTVYDQWKNGSPRSSLLPARGSFSDVRIADMGSGSDYTPFLQRMGVPATDVGSNGPYGAYHSAFDDFAWYTQNADPHFLYLQEMARFLGLEMLRMADADALPYDYVAYAREIAAALKSARRKADEAEMGLLDFAAAEGANTRLLAAAQKAYALQSAPSGDLERLNERLRQTAGDFLSNAGLPDRPWYRHTILAPGENTGYAAELLPGVNDAINAKDEQRAAAQIAVLTQALNRAAKTLDSVR